ncbi:hypothetical protein GCM10010964_31330 [Caldovatus sediminis]|uniref:Uncharacterized protein n=1 Tax=Caldovatus sediminis TaxID=2041189 RepID=A0A8J2ZDQ3_9PROT|nr:hypothetical protein GCM10010964_31330 [Caldovatus sediminis]
MRRARWIGPGLVPAVLLGASLPLVAACTPYATASSARLRAAATEDLCAQRDAPIGGARIRRELRLRGADCSAFEAALAGERRFDLAQPFVPSAPPDRAGALSGAMALAPPGSLPPPVPFGRGLPPPGSPPAAPYGGFGSAPPPEPAWPPSAQFGSAPSPLPGSARPPPLPQFGAAPPAWFAGPEAGAQTHGGGPAPGERWGGGAFAALPMAPGWSEPLPRYPPADMRRAPEGRVALAPPPSAETDEAAAPTAVGRGVLAPLIAPGCAERLVEPPHGPGQQGTVAFRNECGVPIRVRFAARPGVALTEVTPLLRPGETSDPVTLAGGFAHPGYIVCSYERVSERALCQ